MEFLIIAIFIFGIFLIFFGLKRIAILVSMQKEKGLLFTIFATLIALLLFIFGAFIVNAIILLYATTTDMDGPFMLINIAALFGLLDVWRGKRSFLYDFSLF